MEFVSCEETPIREPITWPNMCVWCLGVPTTTYKVRGGGFFRTPWRRSRKKVECPICGEHYFWLRAIDISFFVIFGSWVLFTIIWGLPEFSIWIYFLLALVPSLIRYIIEPVRISEGKNYYTIMIRNERYAREFVLLNNLDNLEPKSESISIEQDSRERLEALRLEFNALAERFHFAKGYGERAKIDAERDRIEKEMNRLRSQLNEY